MAGQRSAWPKAGAGAQRARVPAHPAGRRPPREVDASIEPAVASLAGLSSPTRLVLEVERLRAELAAARARLAELEARADIDPLLDIFNRRGFERELKRALAYVQRYTASAALLYLDLDGFKPVNDAHGHAAGDAVLKAVAAALARHVRASDSVARLGGDEFSVLLWNLGAPEAAAKAAALEEMIAAARVPWNGMMLAVGASAGYTLLSPGDDPAAVLARADHAMYARKAARKTAR
jgi:diguanylate cyclase (GGDEF)-like protein